MRKAAASVTADDTGAGEPRATLVPIDDEGGFLVFGHLPDSLQLDVLPVPYLRDEQVRTLADNLADTAGIGNALLQGWNAYKGTAGLVRLAPETLAALKAGAVPMTQGGRALGTLTKGGKIVAQVRWAPAGAAGVAAGLAALGPALAIVAVQWQMNKISKAVQSNIALTRTNIELTQAVLDEVREGAWYELEAVARVVLDEVRAAQEVGEVTETMWDHLQSQSTLPVLLKHRQRNLDALDLKLKALAEGTGSADWYEKHVIAVIRHGQAASTAQQAISLYQLMRAAYVRAHGGMQDEALREHLLTRTRSEHEQVAGRIDDSLRLLHRSLAIWYEAEPGKRIKVLGGRDVSLRDVRDAVVDLHAGAVAGPFRHLAPLGGSRTVVAQTCVQVGDAERPAIEQKLRWLLDDDESLLLLTRGRYRFGDGRERYLLAVTERRAFLVDSKDLRAGRATVVELPTAGDMTCTHRDQHEWVELHHEGRSGHLQTRAADNVVFDALTGLRSRLAAAASTRPALGGADDRPGAGPTRP